MIGVSDIFAVLVTFMRLSILQITQVQFLNTLFARMLLILVRAPAIAGPALSAS